ncbi:MAG: tRNA (adenosine(37)-N6)-threonylcarbamoyltransferase complex transferase subunit TsaD [Crocinitomicaceae bacterium]|nr:tRNA (adenosine(37)-N6)-threonylcarbamoyltransferase complex transferase subunit TsaD [Crocinitomicaceae bacterium]
MKAKDTIVLGIESSCDDTSAAILKGNRILSNVIAGQSIHEKYGGVVPELASRCHQESIIPVVQQAIEQAGITIADIDAIAFTQGPGLMGSLVVGTSFAKALALSINKPLIPVHHMKAHIMAHFIEDDLIDVPTFPFLCLTVSGGHTQLVNVESPIQMNVIGQTIDDAVGEAFDKAAKMLGLPYPGGPLIDQHAKKGDPIKFTFAKPQIAELNFSFSGVKTSILYFLRDQKAINPNFIEDNLADLCASIQNSLVEILLHKIKKACSTYAFTQVAIAGGVSANSYLRHRLQEWGMLSNTKIFVPKFEYCTDNAAMIAITGKFLFEINQVGNQSSTADPRLIW